MQLTSPPQSSPQVSGHCWNWVALDGADVLMELGLTGRQARVYLSLIKAGNAKVQTIAGPSLVHRQEIYRVLDGLMQIGLVRRNISSPTTYTPTPIEEAVKMLLQQKTNQLNTISKQANQLTKKLCQNKTDTLAINLKPCFGIVLEADRGRKYCKTIKTAQSSIMAVTSWRRFKQLSIHFEDHIQASLRQGVAIRIATEKPAKQHLPKWVKLALSKYPYFEVKTTLDPPNAGVTIFDHTQAAIAFDPNSSLTKGPDMWTTHPALITTCQSYFDNNWATLK
jgi:sugar-specific transcriptional regulator TrmB